MEYTNFGPSDDMPTYTAHVRVNLRLLDRYMAQTYPGRWVANRASPAADDDFKLPKYHFWLNLVRSGATIPRPAFYKAKTRFDIMGGRHRCYALLDTGYDVISIAVPHHEEQAFKSQFGA